jgi:phosphoglycerate dehydrogenase-like enzyme
VQEQPLFEALRDNTIRAAAIDVWYSYPSPDGHCQPSDLLFADLPNLLMTPHSSGVTRETFVGRVRDIADNIRRLDRGLSLARLVR